MRHQPTLAILVVGSLCASGMALAKDKPDVSAELDAALLRHEDRTLEYSLRIFTRDLYRTLPLKLHIKMCSHDMKRCKIVARQTLHVTSAPGPVRYNDRVAIAKLSFHPKYVYALIDANGALWESNEVNNRTQTVEVLHSQGISRAIANLKLPPATGRIARAPLFHVPPHEPVDPTHLRAMTERARTRLTPRPGDVTITCDDPVHGYLKRGALAASTCTLTARGRARLERAKVTVAISMCREPEQTRCVDLETQEVWLKPGGAPQRFELLWRLPKAWSDGMWFLRMRAHLRRPPSSLLFPQVTRSWAIEVVAP